MNLVSSLPKLFNNKAVKGYLLDCARLTRAHKFTGVKKETLQELEAKFKVLCNSHVASLPSKGKRI